MFFAKKQKIVLKGIAKRAQGILWTKPLPPSHLSLTSLYYHHHLQILHHCSFVSAAIFFITFLYHHHDNLSPLPSPDPSINVATTISLLCLSPIH